MTNERAMTAYKATRAGKENKDVKLIQNPDLAEDTALEFANVLGFGPHPIEMSQWDQYNTMMALRHCWHKRDDEHISRSHFASHYLPQLVDAFLNVTRLDHTIGEGRPVHPILNAPTFVLVQLRNNPYVIKYLSSGHVKAAENSGKIAQCLSERLFAASSELDAVISGTNRARAEVGYDPEAIITDVCRVMVRIMVINLDKTKAKTSISPELVNKLVPVLKKWRKRFFGSSTGDLMDGLLQLLGVHPDWTAWQQARDVIENLQTCSKPGCSAKHDLFLCAKCKTVLYCGRQHQREDWQKHKQVCHQTVF